MKLIIKLVFGFIIGIAAGFFTVFNYVFSDSSGKFGERLTTFVIVIIVYAILGLAAGMLLRNKPLLLSAAIVSTPGMAMLILYLLKEPGLFFLSALYLVTMTVSAYAGAYLSMLLTRKRV